LPCSGLRLFIVITAFVEKCNNLFQPVLAVTGYIILTTLNTFPTTVTCMEQRIQFIVVWNASRHTVHVIIPVFRSLSL